MVGFYTLDQVSVATAFVEVSGEGEGACDRTMRHEHAHRARQGNITIHTTSHHAPTHHHAEAEKVAQVTQIKSDSKIMEKEKQKKMSQIKNEGHCSSRCKLVTTV